MGQVDLAGTRLHGGSGLAEPVKDPVGVEDQCRNQEGRPRCRPAGDDRPPAGQDQGHPERQHQLGLHEGQAKGQTGEIRTRPESDRPANAQDDDAVELGVEQQQCGRDAGKGRQEPLRRCAPSPHRWGGANFRPRRQVEAGTEAEEAEQDPQPPTEVGSQGCERDREQRHPGRGKEGQDPADAERHQVAAAGYVILEPGLSMQVVELPGIVDDHQGSGGEGGPVRVDYVLVRQDRIEDKRQRDAEQGDVAPPPPSSHISTVMPSRAARTSMPNRCVMSAAISCGLARQTVIP